MKNKSTCAMVLPFSRVVLFILLATTAPAKEMNSKTKDIFSNLRKLHSALIIYGIDSESTNRIPKYPEDINELLEKEYIFPEDYKKCIELEGFQYRSPTSPAKRNNPIFFWKMHNEQWSLMLDGSAQGIKE